MASKAGSIPGAVGSAVAALLLTAAADAPVSGRDTIGIFRSWGAFRDAQPPRCYAIAQSLATGRGRGWVSVATWPGRGLRESLHVRLSRVRDRSAGATLSVGERHFALVANGIDAWAADAASDRAIATAIRGGRSMSVEAVAVDGRPFADSYALAGAATAIDAAALACAGR